MADEIEGGQGIPSQYTQLIQVQVPLDQAADAFASRDATGRIPIVVVPKQLLRVRNELVAAGIIVLIGAAVAGALLDNPSLFPLSIPVALILIAIGIYRSFIVRIPEGVNGLLARGGRYYKTIGSGTHVIPPWILVSHLVTRREIPFDVPVVEAPTKDNVRATIDTLVTFTIGDPYRFVYSISADDFDQVFQATCQDEMRALVRQIDSEEVMDISQRDLSEFQETLNADVQPYGISISKITIPFAQPPAEFMRSLETVKLAAVQRIEQAEQQALAKQRQADADALMRQQVIARIEREREELQLLVQQAETRRQVVELEAEAEALRLAKMEERLEAFPLAAQYDWESTQLEVARALAGNTRAVVQIGDASDISRAFVLSDLMRFTPPEESDSPTDVRVEANQSSSPKNDGE
jgi:regulator of protease activity HflC (stomatin/prohibitin superfamily)